MQPQIYFTDYETPPNNVSVVYDIPNDSLVSVTEYKTRNGNSEVPVVTFPEKSILPFAVDNNKLVIDGKIIADIPMKIRKADVTFIKK